MMKEFLASVLPYLEIEPVFNEEELAQEGVGQVVVPEVTGIGLGEAREILRTLGLEAEVFGIGDGVIRQFPVAGEIVNQGARVILYVVGE